MIVAAFTICILALIMAAVAFADGMIRAAILIVAIIVTVIAFPDAKKG